MASISDFWREDDACHANAVIGEGCNEVVVRVWRIVNAGDSAATKIDPLAYLEHRQNVRSLYTPSAIIYPNAKDLQSAAGAIEHSGSNIVRAVIDSDLLGSNKITFPMESPVCRFRVVSLHAAWHQLFHRTKQNPPKARFPFFIQAADLISSNEEYLAIS